MHIHIVNAFVEAAQEVLLAEMALHVTRGEVELANDVFTTGDVTVIISLVGDIKGTVLYSLSEAVALDMAGRLLGEPPTGGFGSLAQSSIAEISNVITGRASVKLSEIGYETKLSPPTLLLGQGTILSTLDLPRLVVPLKSEGGAIGLHLALRDTDLHSLRVAGAQAHVARS